MARTAAAGSTRTRRRSRGSWNGQVLLEAELRLRERVPGLVVVRFAGIYGPGREALLARVRAGQGGAARHWTNRIHVEDAAAALQHLLGLAAPASLYLGSDGHPAPEAEVLQWIAQRMGLTVAAPSAGPAQRPPPPRDATRGERIRLRLAGLSRRIWRVGGAGDVVAGLTRDICAGADRRIFRRRPFARLESTIVRSGERCNGQFRRKGD